VIESLGAMYSVRNGVSVYQRLEPGRCALDSASASHQNARPSRSSSLFGVSGGAILQNLCRRWYGVSLQYVALSSGFDYLEGARRSHS